MKGLYYTAPSDELFNEMKMECTEQWRTHDNTYGYVDEKLARIKDIKNVEDNFMYMLAMFDHLGIRSILGRCSPEMCEQVRLRMVDGGNDEATMNLYGLWKRNAQ